MNSVTSRTVRLAGTLAISFVPALAGMSAGARAERGVTSADYEACRAADETAFRTAIETVTVKALTEELKDIDYNAAVVIEWRRLGLDAVIDKRVDESVSEVRDSESWGGLIKSLGSQEKAQELATAVADKVYRSDAMKNAVESLAAAVGNEAGKRIELASQDAATPALKCLETFLGPRYGTAIAAAVTGDAGRDFGLDASKGAADVTPGAVLRQSGEGAAGAAIIVLRRQLGNMARRVGQRLAGSVLSRLVSVAAGGVGLVLVAKDIWELRHGVLPIIAEEMKSEDSKDKVRQELAKTIAEEIGNHVHDIGTKSAEGVVAVWQEFKRAHAKALDLAERDPAFKAFLDSVAPASFARLDEVLTLVIKDEGEAGVLKRAADGSLGNAVNKLPEPGMAIARETGSIATALGWAAIAGPRLDKVVELEIHKRSKPDDFSEAALERVLAMPDRLAATRVAGLSRPARDVLFDLDKDQIAALGRGLDTQDLEMLAGYLKGLTKEPRDRLLARIIAAPEAMRALGSERVQRAVLASADQEAAVDMMISGPGITWQGLIDEVEAVADGRVRPILFWERHPGVVIAGALLALLVLLWLKRLIAPARRPSPPAAPAPTV